MLTLNAHDIVSKRKKLLDGAFQKDYNEAVQKITERFNDPSLLFQEDPYVSITTELEYTKQVLIKDLTKNGFQIFPISKLSFNVHLPILEEVEQVVHATVTSNEPVIEVKVAEIVEAVAEQDIPAPKPVDVVVVKPNYTHGDLQHTDRPF